MRAGKCQGGERQEEASAFSMRYAKFVKPRSSLVFCSTALTNLQRIEIAAPGQKFTLDMSVNKAAKSFQESSFRCHAQWLVKTGFCAAPRGSWPTCCASKRQSLRINWFFSELRQRSSFRQSGIGTNRLTSMI